MVCRLTNVMVYAMYNICIYGENVYVARLCRVVGVHI